MINGISFNLKGIFYCKKKHFCSKCGNLLTTIRKNKIVNSKSKEAENFDFQNVDTYMIGNVKFTSLVLKCPVCDAEYTIKQQKNYENE